MDKISREKPRTIASIAETRVKPTRIPSSSVIGIWSDPLHGRPRSPVSALFRALQSRARDSYHEICKRSRLKSTGPDFPHRFFTARRQNRLSEPQLFGFF